MKYNREKRFGVLNRLSMLGLIVLAVQACEAKKEDANVTELRPTSTAISAVIVAKALNDHGIVVTDLREVTEASDDNHLLGRPGQYTSKVFFYDGRHPKPTGNDTEGENTIEVFDSAIDAKARHDYIASVTKGVPFALQYQLLFGRVLVRLEKILTPSQVAEYKSALKGIE